ncbi:MAG: hypothetical protein Q9M40_00345 [Sulfurimonas sp.]|nr:hypothetical protein [Sulfurimonas sp.]
MQMHKENKHLMDLLSFKDSEIASSTTVDSYPDGWKKPRQELIDNSTIIEKWKN